MGRVAAKVNGPGALLEIGCTAGVELRFDRYHYRIGTASSGPSHAPVRIDVSWRGHERARLGSLPVIAARAGMDLHLIDAADPVERRWLRALVWPENVRQAAQLTAALELVAADPPQIVTGDTTEGITRLSDRLAPGAPLVVPSLESTDRQKYLPPPLSSD